MKKIFKTGSLIQFLKKNLRKLIYARVSRVKYILIQFKSNIHEMIGYIYLLIFFLYILKILEYDYNLKLFFNYLYINNKLIKKVFHSNSRKNNKFLILLFYCKIVKFLIFFLIFPFLKKKPKLN